MLKSLQEMRFSLQQSAPVQWVLQLQVDWGFGTSHVATYFFVFETLPLCHLLGHC
jgi:hypothetical protein